MSTSHIISLLSPNQIFHQHELTNRYSQEKHPPDILLGNIYLLTHVDEASDGETHIYQISQLTIKGMSSICLYQ